MSTYADSLSSHFRYTGDTVYKKPTVSGMWAIRILRSPSNSFFFEGAHLTTLKLLHPASSSLIFRDAATSHCICSHSVTCLIGYNLCWVLSTQMLHVMTLEDSSEHDVHQLVNGLKPSHRQQCRSKYIIHAFACIWCYNNAIGRRDFPFPRDPVSPRASPKQDHQFWHCCNHMQLA